MENYITYNTKELLKDYEQWLKGFRFMTEEKIAAYMDYVKLFVRDAVDFFFAENIIDSLASIARYDQLHGTRYAQLTTKMLFHVHYDKTLSHFPKSDNTYFDRRAALAKLESFLLSKSTQEKIQDVEPASETLISDIRMWRIMQETIKIKNNIIEEIQEEVDNFFSRDNDLEEDQAKTDADEIKESVETLEIKSKHINAKQNGKI